MEQEWRTFYYNCYTGLFFRALRTHESWWEFIQVKIRCRHDFSSLFFPVWMSGSVSSLSQSGSKIWCLVFHFRFVFFSSRFSARVPLDFLALLQETIRKQYNRAKTSWKKNATNDSNVNGTKFFMSSCTKGFPFCSFFAQIQQRSLYTIFFFRKCKWKWKWKWKYQDAKWK